MCYNGCDESGATCAGPVFSGFDPPARLKGRNTYEKIIYPENSEIAMAFQYSALFDFLNVHDNIAFPLVERRELRGKYTSKEISKINVFI